MIRPVDSQLSRISQLWGANPTYYQRAFGIPYHNGVDYAAPLAQYIYCIAHGIVSYKDYDQHGYGAYVRVYHPTLRLFSFYAHMRDLTLVALNDQLGPGDPVGTIGNTGNSTGPHLHFELRLAIDHKKYANSPYAGIARGRINPETVYRMQNRITPEDLPCPENLSSQPQPSSLSSKPPSSQPSPSTGYDSTILSNSLL